MAIAGLCSIVARVVVLGWGLFCLLAGHGQSPSVKDVYQGGQTVIIVRTLSLEEGHQHAEGKTNMLALQNIWMNQEKHLYDPRVGTFAML